MLKILLIAIGTLSLALGVVGVILPGLPTTPFLLLSAACYVRSSERLYAWLMGHRILGATIRRFREKGGMSLRSKVVSLLMMWSMISLSVFVLLESATAKVIVVAAGAIGTLAIILVRGETRREP